jgi:hypothetical protein
MSIVRRFTPPPLRNLADVFCRGQVGKAAALVRTDIGGWQDMPTCRSSFDGELSLSEMLADPIVQAVMARDGTTSEQVVALVDRVRRRLASRRSDASQAYLAP